MSVLDPPLLDSDGEAPFLEGLSPDEAESLLPESDDEAVAAAASEGGALRLSVL